MKDKRKSIPLNIIAFIVSILLIAIDQISKVWVLNTIKPVLSKEILPGILDFTYVENTGAAFGIFKGRTILLAIVSAILLAVIVAILLLNKIKDKKLIWSFSLIVAGGLGNVIDRFYRGFVVDFFDVTLGFLKNFPVFNFADICVVVGAVLLIIYILFSKEPKPNKDL